MPKKKFEKVEEEVPHTVTEEDLKLNPEFADHGIKVGDEIGLPVADVKTSFDVYNSIGTLVRTYSVEAHGESAEALAKEYASKIGGKVL